MKISFVGAGKVGTAIGKYISRYYDVTSYYSKTDQSAQEAAAYVGCMWSSDLKQIIELADVVFITTGDNVIKEVADAISLIDVSLNSKLFIHMSGALTSDELISLKDKGAKISSLHPLQTFSSIDKAVEDLNDAYFSVEGDESVISLVETLGNSYFVLSKDQKTKYHLSACIFSNYLVTLMNFGTKILNDIGIESDDGMKAMKPLIDATLSNIYMKGTEKSLTGPIKRGDTTTLNKHMSELEGLDLEVYQLLGKMTTERLIMDDNKKSMLDALWRRL
ncbi:MAG: DUF2520 domain-containing protein [Clostridiales bacterium]|nr:DUF2520 domain-containing protein [Clostridiales bacterium]